MRRLQNRNNRLTARPGVVLVITLLAVILLAGVVFWVINAGRQVNARVVTQHAADSAAISGAGWMARAFNTVAMNNVAVSRYLALINTLDSIPLTSGAALHEQSFLAGALQDRYQGISTGSAALNQRAMEEFSLLLEELNEEVQTLSGVSQYYQGYDVEEMTHYDGPAGRGRIWRTMHALDQMSQATMENLIPLAKVQGRNAGEANLPANGHALIVTATDATLWTRGSFNDFERPVRQGLLPENVDDTVVNRGPYDTIFGWRGTSRVPDPNYPGIPGYSIISGINTSGSSQPFGGGPGASWQPGTPGGTIATSYYTYGTHVWTLRRVLDWANSSARPSLYRSRFGSWLTQISNTKISYIWPGISGSRYFAQPVWDPNYPEDLIPDPAVQLAFSETAFFRLDIKSRHPRTHSGFMVENGSWAYEVDRPAGNRSVAVILRQGGWWLPNTHAPGSPPTRTRYPHQLTVTGEATIQQVGEMAWLYEFPYTVVHDPEIGITLQLDALGNPIPQPAYFVQLVIYAGVNRNMERPSTYPAPNGDDDPEIVNPYMGFSASAPDAPSPIDLNHNTIDPSAGSRRQNLSVLAVAVQDDTAMIWPKLFDSRRPYPRQTAIAQAGVFNTHSFDLWTQMWHSQLEPITEYAQWVSAMQAGAAAGYPGVPLGEASEIVDYFDSLTPLSNVMLNH